MRSTSRIETAEISDADLNNVSGGLGVTGGVSGAADLSGGSVTGTVAVDGAPESLSGLTGTVNGVTSSTLS